jgi:catechol 2,3-dioxygenase
VIADIAHIGHAELLTPDLAASTEFFTDVLGMSVVESDAAAVYLRGYGQYQLTDLRLTAADAPGLGHLGLRAVSQAALDRCVAALERTEHGLGWSGADVGHGPAFRFTDQTGHVLEVYWEVQRAARRDRRGSAGVGVKRVDHVSLLSADVLSDRRLAENALGYRLLDRVLDDHGVEVGAWMSTSIAPLELVYVADLPRTPPRLHHVAFWVDTREEVLRAADVFADHGIAIEVPPAQHGIGASFFLYAFEPGGNRVEVTTGADFVHDPDPPLRTWTAAERARGVGWGTRFPASWRTYGTPPVVVDA